MTSWVWEFAITSGPRKAWDNEMQPPPGKGWILDTTKGRNGWERFDFHEERYWKRLVPMQQPTRWFNVYERKPGAQFTGTSWFGNRYEADKAAWHVKHYWGWPRICCLRVTRKGDDLCDQ